MLSSLIALSLAQGGPTFPPRTHQPGLVDPGLHGGRIKDQTEHQELHDGPSDLTPDGRVRISFRMQQYPGGDYQWALVAAAVDTELIQTDGDGDLSAFYEPTDPVTTIEPSGDTDPFLGEDFALSSIDESKVIYWAPPFAGADTAILTDDDYCDMDYDLPLPNRGGLANVTLAMLPLDPGGAERGENPYPSDASGSFDLDGGYRTYRIWMVTDHYGEHDDWDCGEPQDPDYPHYPQVPGSITQQEPPRLVSLKLKVVVDLTGASPTIHSATIEEKPYEELTIGTGSTPVRGLECSMTADGTLIVFHGDGPLNEGGSAQVSYVWNPDGCESAGWSAPLHVTDVPPAEFSGTQAEFARSYGFAKYPIREPDNTEYDLGDPVMGAYPWVSKDGSFFVAMHVDVAEPGMNQDFFTRRCGMYVCGDITGGYIKHIDDTALNPTRVGGSMAWPQTIEGSNFTLIDTGRTAVFSTGLKPGLWEPFLGEGVPVPTQRASERIPILPLFVHRTRQYGEVRFEEADGNYLLYLACNESFELSNGNPVMNPRETPDTSGRSTRASCPLNAGAAFPQEVAGTFSAPGFAVLREAIGATIGTNGQPLHENVGYKGQGIVMSPAGNVQVAQSGWTSYGNRLTLQAFVKVIKSSITADWPLIEDDDRFLLQLKSDGSVFGSVTVDDGETVITMEVNSVAGVVSPNQNELDPAEGWRHLTLVYDGDTTIRRDPASLLRLYGDGVLLDTDELLETSTIDDAPSSTIYVGPGRGTPGGNVTPLNMALILDEVAISTVARTLDEIKRDAYVPPEADPFEPLPTAITLPSGLDRAQSKWPVGLAYDADKVDLGEALFVSTLLSKNGTGNRSCATCHAPTDFFADGNTVATALVGGGALPFNVPTSLNMAFGTHKLFDGSAASLEEQIVRPIKGAEMGPQGIAAVLTRIKANALLLADFNAAYTPLASNAHVNEANLKESLAMYVRTLLTGASAFDSDLQVREGLAGTPLSEEEHRGRALFFGKARCFSCHRGSNFSDDDFHNIASVQASEGITVHGGFTQRVTENGQVKTPTLRNVAQTGPWFHEGSKTSLEAVIEHYNAGFPSASGIGILDRQLRPLGLTSGEVDDLIAFLNSLTGTVTQ